MIIISEEKYNEIKSKLVDDGMYHCSVCDSYFIVRNSCDGDINRSICPCCGVYSEDAIQDVGTC